MMALLLGNRDCVIPAMMSYNYHYLRIGHYLYVHFAFCRTGPFQSSYSSTPILSVVIRKRVRARNKS
jgi:hypothetical protein